MAKRPKTIRDESTSPNLLGGSFSSLETQTIYCGDNLEKLEDLPGHCIDLIYIDPPFNSNRNYEVFWGETRETRAFEDRRGSTQAYIEFMRPRCMQLARVLKKTGSLYYHCDWHASHYVKVMLDQIFGENNFQNEIVWRRTNARSDPARWTRMHDILFFYSKSKTYTFNHLLTLGNPEKMPHTLVTGPDGLKYNTYELTGAGRRDGETGRKWRGYDPDAMGRHWGNLHAQLDAWDAAGLIYWPKKTGKTGGFPRRRDEMPFAAESRMVQVGDVWNDVDRLNQSSAERIGFPTQKPLTLLERVIKASSAPDEIVLDAFCGCGTALVAAHNLERRWIGIDISPTACRVISDRLEEVCGLRQGRDFFLRDMPHDEKFLRRIPPFEFENWAVIAVGGTPNAAKVGDKGIDGRIYPVSAIPPKDGKAKGRFDFMDHWYPIQVKQVDKAGRPDIDSFEAVMMREDRSKGFFVSFDYTMDAEKEIRAFFLRTGKEIVPVRVSQILAGDIPIRLQ